MFGVINSRREEIFPGKLSKAVVGFGPAIHRAGDGDAVNAGLRHLQCALLFQIFDRESARRPSAGVQAVELAGLGVPVEQEQVAANSVHHGFGNAEHRVRRNGRVDGRTAPRQNLRPGLRSQGVAGGDDASVINDH